MTFMIFINLSYLSVISLITRASKILNRVALTVNIPCQRSVMSAISWSLEGL